VRNGIKKNIFNASSGIFYTFFTDFGRLIASCVSVFFTALWGSLLECPVLELYGEVEGIWMETVVAL
jgi:hypothetical protein